MNNKQTTTKLKPHQIRMDLINNFKTPNPAIIIIPITVWNQSREKIKKIIKKQINTKRPKTNTKQK